MYQSAYKPHHYTETALVEVFNDILIELDPRNVVCLVLLDLSAVFDTDDHASRLSRLEGFQGVIDGALTWISSYLRERLQHVEELGISKIRIFDIPSSSFLPRFYSKFTEPLGQLLVLFLMWYHFYADATQVIKSANPQSNHVLAFWKLNRILEDLETAIA